MPKLSRDDGTEIHWEERGEGPIVVAMAHAFAYPEALEGLLAELASDHRVVTYDARGTGESSRHGPYDVTTDRQDLEALIEMLGEPAVVLAWGESGHRAVLLAAERADLLPVVIIMGGGAAVVKPEEAADTEGLQGSGAVRTAFAEMLKTDFRGALRWATSSTNPQFSDDEVRDRVERSIAYLSPEATLERFQTWTRVEETADRGKSLGDRLWVIQFPTTWYPRETIDMVRERLPRAHVFGLDVTQGPISRPDIAAKIVRLAVELHRTEK